jgi:hypothetical protein
MSEFAPRPSTFDPRSSTLNPRLMTKPDLLPEDNPFSTRHIRPGAFSFLFPPGESAERLVERLESLRGWGQILGPHGSGKSALLAALVPALQSAGWHVWLVALHDGQRKLPPPLPCLPEFPPPRLLVIDGYEQLGRRARNKIQRLCRKRTWGLLVTAHQSVEFPDLCRLEPSLELARRIVNKLSGSDRDQIPEDVLASLYRLHQGNLREVLFGLYDHYERNRRRSDR